MNLTSLLQMDVIALLQKVNSEFAELAAKLNMNSLILYISAAVLALIVGFAGMHLVKVLTSFGVAGIGFMAGEWIFEHLKVELALSWMQNIPDALAHVLGIVLAIVLFILAWKRCLNVLFGVFAVLGFVAINFYAPGEYAIAVVGALLVGLVAVSIVKLAFIALTSVIGGFVAVSVLGGAWPTVSVLQIGTNAVALWIAVGLSVSCFVVQLISTRNYYLED